MNVDHQQTLGNFGAKPRINFDGQDWVFSFPGKAIISDMERVCKQAARESLLDSQQYLTAADYSAESREHKRKLDSGYYSAPNGEGFKEFFPLDSAGGVQVTPDLLVRVCQCLLAPNHPGITRETVTKLIYAKMDEVVLVIQEVMPSAPPEPEGQAVPKGASGVPAA